MELFYDFFLLKITIAYVFPFSIPYIEMHVKVATSLCGDAYYTELHIEKRHVDIFFPHQIQVSLDFFHSWIASFRGHFPLELPKFQDTMLRYNPYSNILKNTASIARVYSLRTQGCR